MNKININIISFWFNKVTEDDLDGDFDSYDHFFEDHMSCWCKPQVIYIDPITGKRIVLHRNLNH